jgi:hypothetical protein
MLQFTTNSCASYRIATDCACGFASQDYKLHKSIMPAVTRARQAYDRRSVVMDVEEVVPRSANNLRSRTETPPPVVPALDVEEAARPLRAPPEVPGAVIPIWQAPPALERRTGSVVMDVEEAPPPFYRLRRAAAQGPPVTRLPQAQ